MVIVSCPHPGCGFATEDLDIAVVATLVQIHAVSHNVHPINVRNATSGPKLDRPRVDTGINQETWNTFLRRWEAFRIGSGIEDSMAPVQLLQCASDELSEMLLRAVPDIAARTTEEMMGTMKAMAVIPVAKGILRAELMLMHQSNDEGFRSFAARVRSKAETCDFNMAATSPCVCKLAFNVDYCDEIIRAVLLAGISNTDIKQRVLSVDDIHSRPINQLIAQVEKLEMASAASKGKTGVMSASSFQRAPTPPTMGKSTRPSPNQPASTTAMCPRCKASFQPYRKNRNNTWNKRPFKLCLQCWRDDRDNKSSARPATAQCVSLAVAPTGNEDLL